MSVRIIRQPTAEDKAAWDAFVSAHPAGHLLQSSLWGDLKAGFGWSSALVLAAERGAIRAGVQVLLRHLPLGSTMAYAPKGPVVEWAQTGLAQELLAGLDELARASRAWSLLVEPEAEEGSPAGQALYEAGLHPTPRWVQPRSTIWVDLTASPEEMLARMKPKTRYNVRLAPRKGVEVRAATPDELPAVYRLMAETATRDGFLLHAPAYFEAAYQHFVSAGHGELLVAQAEEGLIGALWVFAFGGRAWYMYGASSDAGRHRMPNHLLQWQAMQWARDRGCHTYDLSGIPDEVGQNPAAYERTVTERGDGLWGVYRFKQGWGGRVVRYVGAYQRVYFAPGHWLVEGAWPQALRLWGAWWRSRRRARA